MSPDDTDPLPDLSFGEEEEYTSPGIDPKVAEAMESLRRAQKNAIARVSDVVELVEKKISTPPPKPGDA